MSAGHAPAIARARRRHCRLLAGVVSGLMLASGACAEEAPTQPPQDHALEASGLVAQAAHARESGHYLEARRLCEQAILLDASSAAAHRELAAIDEILAGHPAQGSMEEYPAATELKRQEILADARMAADRADLLAAEGRSEDAVAQLEPAIAALDAIKAQLGPDAAQELDRLKTVDARLRTQAVEDEEAARARVRKGDLTAAEQATRALVASGKSAYQERYDRIAALRRNHHLELALDEARRLMQEYPAEASAEALFRRLLVEVHEQRRLSTEEKRRELLEETREQIEIDLIPEGIDGMPVYPPDFAERHTELSSLEAPAETPPWKVRLLDTLAKHVSLDLNGESGLDAIAALAKANEINLVIDPALQAGGEKPVTLKVGDIRLDHALSYITAQMGTAWQLADGLVYVGGSHESTPIIKVYDVSTLTFPLADHGGWKLGFNMTSQGAGGNGPNLFQKVEETKPTNTPEDVVDLLKKAVSPDTWAKDTNGIAIHGQMLFVTAPPDVQELIHQFIRAQEHQHSLQVKVTTRWVEADDSYLEEIGVDWGNLASNSLLPNWVSPLSPTAVADGVYKETMTYALQGNDVNTLPPAAVNNLPIALNPGLNVSVARIGNTQTSAIFTANETEGRSLFATAPAVTTLNGVQASCFFGQEIAYISSYDVVASTLEPQISVLSVGSSLIIKPFVSADQKYVLMDLTPASASAQLFTEILFAPRIITTGNATFYDGEVPYPIELPNVLIKELSTTVPVPDGATLIIGGFGNTIDQQTATRIPFLGNIPFLGRLFGRRGRYSQRLKLYCLANVSIINYDELEATL
jgi:hypothetical protein